MSRSRALCLAVSLLAGCVAEQLPETDRESCEGPCAGEHSDGRCSEGENASNAPSDCPPVSGDGFCTHGETCRTHPGDCGACGDGLYGTGDCEACISIAQASYAAGEVIAVAWHDIPDPKDKDWICYFPAGAPSDSYDWIQWDSDLSDPEIDSGCGRTDDKSGRGTFEFLAPDDVGTYDLRLYYDDEWGPDGGKGNTGESNLSFTVTAGDALR